MVSHLICDPNVYRKTQDKKQFWDHNKEKESRVWLLR
jgi:hypothetical protein